VEGYALRLAAVATGSALDRMLLDVAGSPRGRCFVEHASVVPYGSCEVAVVVLLLVCGDGVERLTGSALVTGDPKQAVVQATLTAVVPHCGTLLARVDPENPGDVGRLAATEGKMLA
jgi:hypothetical protein